MFAVQGNVSPIENSSCSEANAPIPFEVVRPGWGGSSLIIL